MTETLTLFDPDPVSPSVAPAAPTVRRDASISPCGQYRWWLSRTWDESLPRVCWIGLNPSVADANVDDPTIRRMLAFSRLWDAGSLIVVNLFAWRATDPKDLPDRIPPQYHEANCQAILSAAQGSRVVAAWGSHKRAEEGQRQVLSLLTGWRLECLGTTKEGYPRHPLYVAASTPLTVFREARP